MKSFEFFGGTSQQVTQHPIEIVKIECTIIAAASSTLYFQIHDAKSVPADGAVPLRCWPCAEMAYKEFKTDGPLGLLVGLYVCLSTTSATKTLATGNTYDLLCVEQARPENIIGANFIGDLVTPVNNLVVWTEHYAVTTKRLKLYSLEVDGTNLTAPAFIMLFALDTPTNGTKPLMQWPLAVGQVLTLQAARYFGPNGFDPQYSDSSNQWHYGCNIQISSTTGVLTLNTNGTVCIRAEYK